MMSAPFVLPAIVYGPYRQVRRRVSTALRQFAAGKDWQEALNAESSVSPAARGGLIVLNGPSPLLETDWHFHIFLPLLLLLEGLREGKIDESRKQQAVVESLSTPWGVLGVIAPANQTLVYAPELHRPILRAAIHWWELLDAVGPRYTVGLRNGARLWDVTTNLHYVLGQVGLSNEQLRAPLPAGGLKAIVPPTALG
jgi:hypothetical protein